MPITRAKFKVQNYKQLVDKDGNTYQMTVQLWPVYSDDPTSENHHFWQATPAGQIDLYINNPAAFDAFEEGKEYYVDFTPAE